MANLSLQFLKYPLIGRGYDFFASNHKCNLAKAYIAYSPSLREANDIFWRRGYPLQLRKRLLKTFKDYVANPSMTGVPYSETEYDEDIRYISWWSELLHLDDEKDTLESILASEYKRDVAIFPKAGDESKTDTITNTGNFQTITLKVGETYEGDIHRVKEDGSADSSTGSASTLPVPSSDDVASYELTGTSVKFTAKAIGNVDYVLISGDKLARKIIHIDVVSTTKSSTPSTNPQSSGTTAIANNKAASLATPSGVTPSASNKNTALGTTTKWGLDGAPAGSVVTWTSGDDKIATITADGTITPTGKVGDKVTMTARYDFMDHGSPYYGILHDDFTIVPVKVKSITVPAITMKKGDAVSAVANVLPANATDKSVTWSTHNSSQVTINADTGALDTSKVASSVGITITATTKDGTNLSANGTVTINV